MKYLGLTKGQVALVDDEDFEWLSQWKWTFYDGYAHRMDGKKKVYLHRQIMGFPEGLQVDHKNEEGEIGGLNNQRYNLRVCNNAQNNSNRGLQRNNTSGFKGLYLNKKENVWIARIKHQGKYIYLGRFRDKLKAAKAYNIAAIKYFGEFAVLNRGIE